MFKTHESAYQDLQAAFGPGHHHWRLVEREIATPWLHATILVTEDGVEYASTVMPSDLHTFLEVANAKDAGARVSELQLMSPAWMNGAERWLLEPIRQIDIASSADDEMIHIYLTESGNTYYDPSRTLAEIQDLMNQRTVYHADLS
jgi:hypothetical protein